MTELDESLLSLTSPDRLRFVKFADDGYAATAADGGAAAKHLKGDRADASASSPVGSGNFEASLLKLVHGAAGSEEEAVERDAEEVAASTAASLLGGNATRNAIVQRHMARKIAHSLNSSQSPPRRNASWGNERASSESPALRHGPLQLQPVLSILDPVGPVPQRLLAPAGASLQKEVLKEEAPEGAEIGAGEELTGLPILLFEGSGERGHKSAGSTAVSGDDQTDGTEAAEEAQPPAPPTSGRNGEGGLGILGAPAAGAFGRTPSAGFAELLSALKADNQRHRSSPSVSRDVSYHNLAEEWDSASRGGAAKVSVGFVEEDQVIEHDDGRHAERGKVPGVKTVLSHHELLGEDKFQDMLRQLKEAQAAAKSPSAVATQQVAGGLGTGDGAGGHGRSFEDTDVDDSLLSRRVVSRQHSDDVFEDVLARQALNRDRRMRTMGQVSYK